MRKVEYIDDVKKYVDGYDFKNHSIWNENSDDIIRTRKCIRDHYLLEQNFCCAYCRIQKKEKHGMTWDVEHILPKSKYPEFLFEPLNLVVACKECNSSKDDYDILQKKLPNRKIYPIDSENFSIIHPHYDKYSKHIEIVAIEGKRRYRVLDKTKGRNTYIACNFFRFDYEYGEWESFDDAIISEFSSFLDNCPSDATPVEVKRQLGHLQFVLKCDF